MGRPSFKGQNKEKITYEDVIFCELWKGNKNVFFNNEKDLFVCD